MKKTKTRQLSLILVCLLLLEPFGSRVFHHEHQHHLKKKSKSYKRISPVKLEFRPNSNKWDIPKHSQPKELSFTPKIVTKQKGKKLRKLLEQENILRLAQSIKSQAKKHKLKIKRVYLGQKAKSKFKDSSLERDLSNLLSKKSLKGRMRKLKKRIKKASKRSHKRKQKLNVKHQEIQINQINQNSVPYNRNLVSMGGGSSKKSKPDEMGFNFMPGFSGMPFPPFMMNGPHFHPPLNVTVNTLPHKNRRAEQDASTIQQDNLREDQNFLGPILEHLHNLDKKLKDAKDDTNVVLEDKYQRVLSGFV